MKEAGLFYVRAALAAVLAACMAGWLASAPAVAQQVAAIDTAIFREFSWRSLGPFQGGDTTAVQGVPSQPNVFLLGTAGGGVWRTNDAGRTWRPVFDAPVGSIAIAASDANIIYVGTGAGSLRSGFSAGTGLYRSADGGRTWTALGLTDSRVLPRVAVDPRDPNRVFVAALGHPYGPNPERGVFRSTDGGRTFAKVLFKDADTGALDVVIDPENSSTVYAALGRGGLYKSVDGGTTWRQLERGLPSANDGLSRIALAVAPTYARRLFAFVTTDARGRALYRSDDAGESWTAVTGDMRPFGDESAAPTVAVDPRNADIVYIANGAVWKSTDGGMTWSEWRRDPSGALFSALWISPANPNIVSLASSRGGSISVNGGESWSATTHQPTGQFAHVASDNAFPYRICTAGEAALPACMSSRTGRVGSGADSWSSISLTHNGFLVPDPGDAEVIYSGTLGRYDRRIGQRQDVSPPMEPADRLGSTAPIVFAPTDVRTLYFATSRLWKSTNGGQNWSAISPHVSGRGSISAIAPSSVDSRVIWVGTTDGAVQTTRDAGTTWTTVALPGARPSAISGIETSHFDANTSYVALDAARIDDESPQALRTRDGGATWTPITQGLPDGARVYALREDPYRRGLLFAATERSIFVSFDDGDSWRPFRLNLPAVAVRDIAIKDADLVIATYGRGVWIFDDMSPLRQLTADVARADVFLFRPTTAWRINATSVAPAQPASDSGISAAPDGVIFQYLLGPNVRGPVTLEVIETLSGDVIRRFSSERDPRATSDARSPVLSTSPGLHRVVWDLRYAPIDAEAARAAGVPNVGGTWVMPTAYQVRLSANNRQVRQAVVVRMDPRVRTAPADLAAQHRLSRALDGSLRAVVAALAAVRQSANGVVAAAGAERERLLSDAAQSLAAMIARVQESDTRPTSATETAAMIAIERAGTALAASPSATP